jgi:hypothetical protein
VKPYQKIEKQLKQRSAGWWDSIISFILEPECSRSGNQTAKKDW